MSTQDATSRLTPKQEAFCLEYLVDLNGTQAAIRAGYSKKTAEAAGSRLLRNVKVTARIQQLRNEQQKRVEVTADYVLTTIIDTIERCKQAEPVTDKKGEIVKIEDPETGEMTAQYKYDAAAVLKGSELLGKHLAMWTEKREVTGKDGGPIQIDGMSDEELDARIKAKMRELGI